MAPLLHSCSWNTADYGLDHRCIESFACGTCHTVFKDELSASLIAWVSRLRRNREKEHRME